MSVVPSMSSSSPFLCELSVPNVGLCTWCISGLGMVMAKAWLYALGSPRTFCDSPDGAWSRLTADPASQAGVFLRFW
ncbi:hypothetical protein D3C85_1622100 [compost metagenome]